MTLKRRTKEGLDTKTDPTEGREGVYCAVKQPKELPLDIRNKSASKQELQKLEVLGGLRDPRDAKVTLLRGLCGGSDLRSRRTKVT